MAGADMLDQGIPAGCADHADHADHAEPCGGHAETCGCCGREAEEEEEGGGLRSAAFIAGAILFAAGLVLHYGGFNLNRWIVFAVFAAAYLLSAKDVLRYAAKGIAGGQAFDENLLMTIASIGAFAIGEYPEAVAVILFYNVGEYLQGRAVRHSRKSIARLMDIRPDSASLLTADGVSAVAAESVRPGDLILVRPGERIPLDGEISEGSSSLDTRALTGESMPVDVEAGDSVLSGSVNGQGLLRVRVTKAFLDSTASKIIAMVEKAGDRKAKTENFITRFARCYTPAVVAVAVLLAAVPPLLGLGAFTDWVYRALVFLVVSCPCALVISIPLGFFGGIGAASARGVLVKGGNFLEALTQADTVVFDKTGTLTGGVFHVAEILPAPGFTEEEALRLGALAERHSTHPVAASIREMYASRARSAGGRQNAAPDADAETEDVREVAGHGVRVRAAGSLILAGNRRWMEREGVSVPEFDKSGTIVYIAKDGVFAGALVVADAIRADSQEAVEGLRRRGIREIIMLTGDSSRAAADMSGALGLDRVEAGLLPDGKVGILETLLAAKEGNAGKKRGKVIFVGDGVNDAPALARADVGVAMGGVGSDAAIEAADVVIMNDEPSKLLAAIDVARGTHRIVWQNIILALGIKALVLLLAALGFASIWEAVFADVGVALLATLNAVRAGHIKAGK